MGSYCYPKGEVIDDCKPAELNQRKRFDIRNAIGSESFKSFGGKTTYIPAFKTNEEKERTSKIAEQLKGMTVREVKNLLSRVSDAIEDVLLQ
ncbi:MAG: hypothetical protein NC235_12065 [Clostridiales bacterium]|nr:hypothetical protein [Clostridiales bacterium]